MFLNDVEFDLKPLNPANQFPDQKKVFRDLQHPGPSLHKIPFLQMFFTQIFGNFSFLKP